MLYLRRYEVAAGLEGVKDHVTQGIQVRDISSLEDNWTRSGGETEHFWRIREISKAWSFY